MRLRVVATPIGNLDDLAPRAAAALRDADLILAEDTRRTARLLQHIGADTRQRSLHEHNERERIPEVLGRIAEGAQVALVSDAGMPAVSDPGYRLIAAAIDANVVIEVIPGPSAVLHALVASGLPTDRFVFEGFLPRRGASRRARLAELAREPRTVVLFVSPHRAADDLTDLRDALGADRRAAVARELTKLHEEVRRGTLGDLAAALATEPVRGEVTLVIGGAPAADAAAADLAALVARVQTLVAAGARTKAAVAEVAAAAGVAKRDLYQAVVEDGSGSRGAGRGSAG